MLKKSTLLFVSIFVLLFIGLSDYGYGCHKGGNDSKGCGGGGGDDGGDDKYSVMVTFRDSKCGTTAGDHFCSDTDPLPSDPYGGDPYIDGVNQVGAGGDKFRFGLTLQNGTPRRFFLDFSDNCVGSCSGDVPNFGDGAKLGLTSGSGTQNVFSTAESGFSLLDMEAGGDSQDRDLSISFRDTNNHSWKLSFNPDVCVSDPVSVTRTTEGWNFVSEGETTTACLERAKNGTKGPPILQGRYRVPFTFTVTLWP